MDGVVITVVHVQALNLLQKLRGLGHGQCWEQIQIPDYSSPRAKDWGALSVYIELKHIHIPVSAKMNDFEKLGLRQHSQLFRLR